MRAALVCFVLLLPASGIFAAGPEGAANPNNQKASVPDELGEGPAIGVILPLSGRSAAFGEEALKGALLGMGFYDTPARDARPARWRFSNVVFTRNALVAADYILNPPAPPHGTLIRFY